MSDKISIVIIPGDVACVNGNEVRNDCVKTMLEKWISSGADELELTITPPWRTFRFKQIKENDETHSIKT